MLATSNPQHFTLDFVMQHEWKLPTAIDEIALVAGDGLPRIGRVEVFSISVGGVGEFVGILI